MGTRRLTVYLMREDIQNFDDARATAKTADSVDTNPTSGVDGRFYRVQRPPTTPPWVGFVEPILAEPLGDMRSSSASGLLLLRASGRLFAVTFGFGRSLLDLSKVEYQFGLRVALNRIDPAQLRSVDTKAFEDMVVSTTRQTSRSAELPAFGVDVSTDILRAATGTPRDVDFAKRLSGADALVMSLSAEATDLTAMCGRLLEAYGADDYKTDFGWIDQLALVRNEKVLDDLDAQLIGELTGNNTTSTHLAMPEPIGWEEIDAFKISGTGRHEYDDLELDEYLSRLGDRRGDLTIDLLKSRRVSVRFARSEAFDDRWSLYRCLVSEQRVDDTLHVLIEGRWFAVSDSLVAEVDAFLETLSETGVELPASLTGEAESDYNTRAAGESAGSMFKMDARIKRPGGAASGIELCDLMTSDGDLVHVKRKARSATLSHLFAQGSVSARSFLDDGTYRDELRTVIDAEAPAEQRDRWLDLIPASSEPVERARYCVTYAVIANSLRTGKDWLPFFSKLNLMQHARQIMRSGFRVAVVRVPIESTDDD